MELMIPYLMALIGFFVINKDRSNRIVTVLFGWFYSANMAFNMGMDEGPDIYLVELLLITGFFVAVTLCISILKIKVTMMIMILCVADVIVASMDIVAFLTYYDTNETMYTFAYNSIFQLFVIQYAALWVNDARSINVRSYYDNMWLYIRDFALRTLYR